MYWLFKKDNLSEITVQGKSNQVTLSNGLISRTIDTQKGTVSYTNLILNKNIINKTGTDSEIVINGKVLNFYDYFVNVELANTFEDVPFKGNNHMIESAVYPPKGSAIILNYHTPDKIDVKVMYEIFDNLPVICKRIHIINHSGKDILINKFVADRLHISKKEYADFYGETNYNGGCGLNNNRCLSVQYDSTNEILNMAFDMGPMATVHDNETFTGLRAYELCHGVHYHEQRMIEVKQMYRVLFPWVTNAPLIYHVTSDLKRNVKRAVNQAKTVGFDGVIQSFGSGINIESRNMFTINKHRKLYDYAHSQGILIGGYTLAIIKNYRKVLGKEANPTDCNGVARCLATEWSQKYWNNILNFYDKTGADLIEIDGPYHFYRCAGGPTHLHKGLEDSRYLQWKLSNEDVFKRFKNKGIYINTPDWMYMNGTNKCGIGYEEIAFSEPRQHQLISARQYNYKGTFNKIPSMAWGFLPLTVYHGGGRKAEFLPRGVNYKDYEWAIFQGFMSGVIPCFRGAKLYDDDKSLEIIRKWTAFYKKYSHIINGTTVHCLPAKVDEKNKGRTTDIDGIFNCVGYGEIRGILAIFNQTDKAVKKTIKVPVFYTNLCGEVTVPSPHKNCGIIDVETPDYGDFPPPYPTDDPSKIIKNSSVMGMNDSILMSKENIVENEFTNMVGEIKVSQENGADILCKFDNNCDMYLEIDLKPMSYTYYMIKE